MISFGSVSGYQFSKKSGKKKLRTDHHCDQGNVKQRSLRHSCLVKKEFGKCEIKNYNKPKKKKGSSPQTKKMHWIFSELSDEHDGSEIKKSIDEAGPSKFGHSIFSGTVFYYLLAKFFEPGPLCDQGNIAMHFAIYFNVFYHFAFVGF